MLKRALLTLLVLATMVTAAASDLKYIFYYIGDGMGMAQVMSADLYSRTVSPDQKPLLMTTFPVASYATTFSASSPVTDSAAAGTALATGHKTRNSMLGMSADTVPVYSIASRLKDLGWGVGIVTSVAADDATPGAFYAHQPNRGRYLEIGREFIPSGFDYLAGAGLRAITDKQGHSTGLLEDYAGAGILVTRSADEARRSPAARKVLLSPDTLRNWNINFTIDSVAGALTLRQITEVGLEHLQRVSPDAFFMMVEGGNIDHAGHANDAATVLKEVINFNEALDVAYQFYLQHPDETLIVVTADHETGGMAIGNNTLGYNANVALADHQRISKDRFAELAEAIIRQEKECPTWDAMREFLHEKLGFWGPIPVSERETELLHQSFIRTFIDKVDDSQITLYSKAPRFVVDVYSILNNLMGIGWTTLSHSGNPVPVYAVGHGAEQFGHVIDNTQIPATMQRLVDAKSH